MRHHHHQQHGDDILITEHLHGHNDSGSHDHYLHPPCRDWDCPHHSTVVHRGDGNCLDCDAPLRPLPPEFQDPPQQPDPPQVTRLESWTGEVLYCQRCFDALDGGPTTGAPTLADIERAAAIVYKPEGVAIWLYARNRALGGESPAELVKRGDGDRVLGLLLALAEGVTS